MISVPIVRKSQPISRRWLEAARVVRKLQQPIWEIKSMASVSAEQQGDPKYTFIPENERRREGGREECQILAWAQNTSQLF